MATIAKTVLLSGVYSETEGFYAALPATLTIPTYFNYTFSSAMTTKELMNTYNSVSFTINQAFAVIADYSQTIANGQWRVSFFNDSNNIPCALYLSKDGSGVVNIVAQPTNPGDIWSSGGVLVSTQLPSTVQTFTGTGNVTVTQGVTTLRYNPALIQTSATITMPPNPADMDVLETYFGGTMTSGTVVSSLSMVGNMGQSMIDSSPALMAEAGTFIRYKWNASLSSWQRAD